MKLKQWLARPLAAALGAAAPAMAAEKFRVGYLRVMDDAQAIVAQEGDFYKKAGLDAELIEFKSGTDLIKAIVGGQADIGVLGFTNAVAWASKGANLKVVGGAQQGRSEAHTSELQSLMSISYAVFCMKHKTNNQ